MVSSPMSFPGSYSNRVILRVMLNHRQPGLAVELAKNSMPTSNNDRSMLPIANGVAAAELQFAQSIVTLRNCTLIVCGFWPKFSTLHMPILHQASNNNLQSFLCGAPNNTYTAVHTAAIRAFIQYIGRVDSLLHGSNNAREGNRYRFTTSSNYEQNSEEKLLAFKMHPSSTLDVLAPLDFLVVPSSNYVGVAANITRVGHRMEEPGNARFDNVEHPRASCLSQFPGCHEQPNRQNALRCATKHGSNRGNRSEESASCYQTSTLLSRHGALADQNIATPRNFRMGVNVFLVVAKFSPAGQVKMYILFATTYNWWYSRNSMLGKHDPLQRLDSAWIALYSYGS
eukprot:scaffold741_cov336-Pavlova_lutheri.AAC.36